MIRTKRSTYLTSLPKGTPNKQIYALKFLVEPKSLLHIQETIDRTKPTIDSANDLMGVITYLKKHSSSHHAKYLSGRIQQIHKSLENQEEYPEQKAPIVASFRRAIQFLENFETSIAPDLILTFDGYPKLIWESKNANMQIIFSKSNQIFYRLKSHNSALRHIDIVLNSDDEQLDLEINAQRSFLLEILA